MAGESTGWNGEFHLHNGTALTKLVGVTEVGIPQVDIELLETTPLDAAGKFKQYIAGLKDGGEFPVVMNYVPQSATDLLCEAALGNTRTFKIVEPDFDGAGVQDITGSVVVRGYAPNPMKANEVRTATLTLKLSGTYTKTVAA